MASKSPRCRYKKKIFIACTNAARSISLVRARYARPAQNTFFVKVSPQLRVSATLLQVFGHHRRKELAREEEEKRYKKTTREKPLSRERAFLKNTNTIYDIKYAAIFHVQNDVRVPRRHFSFHRHLTHVLRRPGRRREHFTFHFFLFQRVLVSFNYVFFIVVCSSFLFFRVFFTRKRTKNQIKRYLETSARANQKAHEGGLFPLDGLKKKCFIQAHCFRRKSRSQTTNKKLFCSRERERGFEGEDDALG